ncbi:hypothetical protein HEM47_023675, partial [Escherichia coli]|nr:hypothetical protein [Escherichia coli]
MTMINLSAPQFVYIKIHKNYSHNNRDDVVFEVDLLKSQEINLDYIL